MKKNFVFALLTLASFVNLVNLKSQTIIYNGSFEIYDPNNLPRESLLLNPPEYDYSKATEYIWINRSIGFCQDPEVRYERQGPQHPLPPPPNCNNWYSPTDASPDYYHRLCNPSNAPNVRVPDIFIRQGNNREMRQPFGYEIDQTQNAYCGLTITKTPLNELTNYPYSEYLQTKL